MNHSPNRKRVVFFTILFVLVAFLIVFFTQKRNFDNVSNELSASRADNIPFEARSITPLPTLDAPLPNTTSGVSVKNLETGNTRVISTNPTTQKIDKKIIKTGNIEMRVNSVEQAINEIRDIARQNGGDEISSDFSKTDTYKQGYINIKVPIEQYDTTFKQIKDIAPLVIHESSRAQNVTAEFIDLESRIKNKKEHERQLRSLFEKAEKVDDLISVERELSRVRTEIEQMEGQMKYLKDQTQYSTINVTLYENSDIVISDSWRPMQVVKDSFGTLIHKTTNLINVLIRFTITSLPFIVLFLLIAWISYFTLKRIFKK